MQDSIRGAAGTVIEGMVQDQSTNASKYMERLESLSAQAKESG